MLVDRQPSTGRSSILWLSLRVTLLEVGATSSDCGLNSVVVLESLLHLSFNSIVESRVTVFSLPLWFISGSINSAIGCFVGLSTVPSLKEIFPLVVINVWSLWPSAEAEEHSDCTAPTSDGRPSSSSGPVSSINSHGLLFAWPSDSHTWLQVFSFTSCSGSLISNTAPVGLMSLSCGSVAALHRSSSSYGRDMFPEVSWLFSSAMVWDAGILVTSIFSTISPFSSDSSSFLSSTSPREMSVDQWILPPACISLPALSVMSSLPVSLISSDWGGINKRQPALSEEVPSVPPSSDSESHFISTFNSVWKDILVLLRSAEKSDSTICPEWSPLPPLPWLPSLRLEPILLFVLEDFISKSPSCSWLDTTSGNLTSLSKPEPSTAVPSLLCSETQSFLKDFSFMLCPCSLKSDMWSYSVFSRLSCAVISWLLPWFKVYGIVRRGWLSTTTADLAVVSCESGVT